MLLKATAIKKTLFTGIVAGIRVFPRKITGFTKQRNAFTLAQSAILQGRDFNFAHKTSAKNSLSTKLICKKLIR